VNQYDNLLNHDLIYIKSIKILNFFKNIIILCFFKAQVSLDLFIRLKLIIESNRILYL